MTHEMTFDAVSEAKPGRKWQSRWRRTWPDYEAWFCARGGDDGPSRTECEAALADHMPELVPLHARLTELAGGGDRAARFLSAWCPPAYLGGCTLAAHQRDGDVRLVRNYDLSPDLNEGLLLRSEWRRPVMGMVEFLWGLSDGINDAGLSVALAYGGRQDVARGFGITLILRYVLETCDTVAEAVQVLRRIPSHMAYNIVLADRSGDVASIELMPGGGLKQMPRAAAANHQSGHDQPHRAWFTRTLERHAAVECLVGSDPVPAEMSKAFLAAPLHQTDYAGGFGTLFTADYDPVERRLALLWPDDTWEQSLHGFIEGRRIVKLGPASARPANDWWTPVDGLSDGATVSDWIRFGLDQARRFGVSIVNPVPDAEGNADRSGRA